MVLGGVNLFKEEEMDQIIPVVETIVHENYRETNEGLYNDVGLCIFFPFSPQNFSHTEERSFISSLTYAKRNDNSLRSYHAFRSCY